MPMAKGQPTSCLHCSAGSMHSSNIPTTIISCVNLYTLLAKHLWNSVSFLLLSAFKCCKIVFKKTNKKSPTIHFGWRFSLHLENPDTTGSETVKLQSYLSLYSRVNLYTSFQRSFWKNVSTNFPDILFCFKLPLLQFKTTYTLKLEPG